MEIFCIWSDFFPLQRFLCLIFILNIHSHSGRGKSPVGSLFLSSSVVRYWKPHHDDGGSCWLQDYRMKHDVCACVFYLTQNTVSEGGFHGDALTHLNWQKMSAYSGGMPAACRTVTRKVKTLPTSSWPITPSDWPSLPSTFPSFRSETKNTQQCSDTSTRWGWFCYKTTIRPLNASLKSYEVPL